MSVCVGKMLAFVTIRRATHAVIVFSGKFPWRAVEHGGLNSKDMTNCVRRTAACKAPKYTHTNVGETRNTGQSS